MERYVRMYLQGAPAMFQTLLSRLDAGGAEGLAIAAHSLRPQVNYMGAQCLFALLSAIETEARPNGASASRGSVLECLAMNTQVVAELDAWLAAGA